MVTQRSLLQECHLKCDFRHFYSAATLHAMQSAVIATAIPSVCPSVCPSVRLSVCPSVRHTLLPYPDDRLRGLHCEVAKTL